MTNRGVIAVAAVALLVSSCSTIGGSDAASDDTVASPISQFLGIDDFADFESEDGQARMIELQRQFNDAVVACMAEQGFDYIPPDPDETVSFAGQESDEPAYGSPEYTARYGFGVTTQRWPQDTVGPDLVGYDDSVDTMIDDVDPNESYLAGLSEQERSAFEAALYGNSPDYEWDPSLTDEENQTQAEAFYRDVELTGCFNAASSTGDFANVSAFYEQFGEQLATIDDQVRNDPRLTEQRAKIESCVAGKGLDFVDPDLAYEHWSEALDDIDQNHTVVDQERVTMDTGGKALLADLQAEEIAIATATEKCGGSQREMAALYQEVSADYEQRFLDDNADAVAAFAGEGN